MPNEFAYIPGKVKWFRATSPDEHGWWKHVLYPTPEGLETIKVLMESTPEKKGILNHLKKDEDGYNMTFRRPVQKMIRGQMKGFTPPQVFDGSKKLPDGTHPPMNELVGNGSDVVTKLEVYTFTPQGQPRGSTVKGTAARWLSSRIDNLVPYTTKRDATEPEERAMRGLDNQPDQPGF